jgi:hypothetical protein
LARVAAGDARVGRLHLPDAGRRALLGALEPLVEFLEVVIGELDLVSSVLRDALERFVSAKVDV